MDFEFPQWPSFSNDHQMHNFYQYYDKSQFVSCSSKDFIYRGGHVTAEKLTNLWPSKSSDSVIAAT